ncbi:MAG: hypothetical protein KGY45_03895 [Hadesarchaea archaeon]|nr:hypothetical protein [Hadesarchaea archaeon]
MELKFSKEVTNQFPNLKLLKTQISGLQVEKKSRELEEFKNKINNEIKNKYELEELKNNQIFRAYRDFFWQIDIDPTKTRPASEALVRRILQGKSLPTINTLVDAYNLASLSSGIPLAVFDLDSLKGDLVMRFAQEGEEFHGIGMSEPIHLDGGEIVVSDRGKLIAIYPYRDSNDTRITLDTKNALIMTCGAPGIDREKLEKAEEKAIRYVTRFCGGSKE